MPTPTTIPGNRVWELPPLILHPFTQRVPPSTLLENSRAALMLAGILPDDGSRQEDLQNRLLVGRYAELRMLFYLGKDIFRWMDQCYEWSCRIPELAGAEIHRQSFAALLSLNPPQSVKEKLTGWGVVDHRSIFSRAIGLKAVFVEPPALETLENEFPQNYHLYADALYHCYLRSQAHASLDPANFQFDLYASGEFSRRLESEWSGA